MMGIVSVAVVAATPDRLIPSPAFANCKLLILLGSNFTLILPVFVSSISFFRVTAISFSVRSVASVPAQLKVYFCVVFVLEVGLTVIPEPSGSSILLPFWDMTVIVPVDFFPAAVCTM